VLKIAVLYDRILPNIRLVYAKIFMFFKFQSIAFLQSNYRNITKLPTASLNQYEHKHSKARDITQSLEKHVLLSSHI
jgi:hypothetical protein